MKRLVLACLLTLTVFIGRAADLSTESYVIDDQQIEAMLTQSEDVSLAVASGDLLQSQQATASLTGTARVQATKEFAPALLLNLFLGGLGINRLYLGTKTITWVGYILTCGGIFGVVPLVDLIVLIIHNDNITPYIDNTKFFMWSN